MQSFNPKISHNALGLRIHQSEQGLRRFWDWFAGSHVIDKYGAPLPVYHGTCARFSVFAHGIGIGGGMHGAQGFFFAKRVCDARSYARRTAQLQGGRPLVMACYLALRNPRILDLSVFYDMAVETGWARRLQDMGYDGVIAIGGFDDGRFSDNQEYVVFSPTQIKSIKNGGGYCQTNPDIYL